MIEKIYLQIEKTTVGQLFAVIVAGTVTWLLLTLLRKILIKRMAKHTQMPAACLRDLILQTGSFFIIIFSVFVGLKLMSLPAKIQLIIDRSFYLIIIFQIGIWGQKIYRSLLKQERVKVFVEQRLAKGALQTIDTIIYVMLWSTLALLMISSLGFDVGPLIAGLGIGGIAIAFGVQNTLQDIAASISILVDKPFMVGDLIAVDEYKGTIEYIGIKTTRMKSIWGEQIVFSNSDLLKSRIRNYKQLYERRVVFDVRVPYETPYSKVREVPAALRSAVESLDKVRFERAHLKEFAEFSFAYEIVYFVLDPDYTFYMDVQQKINILIMDYFEKEGIAFACPERKITVNRVNDF